MYFLHIPSQQLMTFSIKNLFFLLAVLLLQRTCAFGIFWRGPFTMLLAQCVWVETHTDTQRHFHMDAQTQYLKNVGCIYLCIYLHIYNENTGRYLYVWISIMNDNTGRYLYTLICVNTCIFCSYNKLLNHFHREVRLVDFLSMKTNIKMLSN